MYKTILRENSKNSAAKEFRIDIFLKFYFFKFHKLSNFNLESWFAYPQNPNKKLSTMAKYVFFKFNKYRDVQRKKGFSNLELIYTSKSQNMGSDFCPFYFKGLLPLFAILLVDHLWTSVHCF